MQNYYFLIRGDEKNEKEIDIAIFYRFILF